MRDTILATVALAALGLSACTGQSGPAGHDVSSSSGSTESSSASTSPATLTTQRPANRSVPLAEDAATFRMRYKEAYASIKTMSVKLKSQSGTSEESVDKSDPAKKRVHTTLTSYGQKTETLQVGDSIWVRTGGEGKWTKTEQVEELLDRDDLGGSVERFHEASEVKLADRVQRKYQLLFEDLDYTLWVDTQHRPVKWVTGSGQTQTTATYSNFNEPIEFPDPQ